MEVQKSIDAVRQQDVLKKSLEIEKLSLSICMGLGVVCGLRKVYTTLGKWLKAWVRSTDL